MGSIGRSEKVVVEVAEGLRGRKGVVVDYEEA